MDTTKPIGRSWTIEANEDHTGATLVAGPCGLFDAMHYARGHRRLIADRPDLYPGRIVFCIGTRDLGKYGFNADGSRI